jgi:hypothetical protein
VLLTAILRRLDALCGRRRRGAARRPRRRLERRLDLWSVSSGAAGSPAHRETATDTSVHARHSARENPECRAPIATKSYQ